MEIQAKGKTIRFGEGCNFLPVNELVPYAKNPKNHSDKDINLIIKSIERNGFGENLLVCPETKEVLSGNGRLMAAKKMGLEQVPCVYVPKGLTEKQKADIVIASNKLVEVSGYNNNLGFLMDNFGLNPDDFGINIAEKVKSTEEEGEVPFTEELLEEHNYIVLYFDNAVDWLQAETLFGKYITTKQALGSKEGFRKMGKGRVVKGADVLKDLVG